MSLTNYPRLFAKSALYHAIAIILFVVLTLVSKLWKPKPVHVFELVAGAGDNYRATEAPAAAPVVAAPVIPIAPAPTPRPTPAPQTTPKSVPTPATPPPKMMTREEFLAQNPQKSQPATPPRSQPKIEPIDTSKLADPLRQGSSQAAGAGGTALRTNNVDERAAFDALLRKRLRENLVRPAGLSLTLEADARIQVARDGGITGTITRSSGNTAFDQAVREAIARTAMPSPPSGYDSAVSVTFRMRDESQ